MRRPFSREADLVDSGRVDRRFADAARRTVTVPLGTIEQSLAVIGHGAFQFSSSYSTGGEDATPPEVPNLARVGVFPMGGYNFEYVNGTGKIKAYTGGNVEVGAGQDLSALNPIVVSYGEAPSRRRLFVFDRTEFLIAASYCIASEVVESSTNYWTMQLVLVEADGTHKELGAIVSSEVATLGADAAIEFHAPTGGLALTSGQTLALDLVATGNPSALVDLVVSLELGRRA